MDNKEVIDMQGQGSAKYEIFTTEQAGVRCGHCGERSKLGEEWANPCKHWINNQPICVGHVKCVKEAIDQAIAKLKPCEPTQAECDRAMADTDIAIMTAKDPGMAESDYMSIETSEFVTRCRQHLATKNVGIWTKSLLRKACVKLEAAEKKVPKCPFCEKTEIEIFVAEDNYGSGEIFVPIHHCKECEGKWTDNIAAEVYQKNDEIIEQLKAKLAE